METSALSALLRKSRSAAKAFALPALLTVGAAGAVLFPGSAKAIDTVSSYSCVLGPATNTCENPVQLGDKKVTFLGFELLSGDITKARDVSVNYAWLDDDGIADQNFSDDVWTFKVSNPDGTDPFSGPFSIRYTYRVDIVSGADRDGFVAQGDPWYFNAFGLDSDVPALVTGSSVVKDVNTGEVILTSTNGSPAGPGFFSDLYKSALVEDTITVNQGGAIFSVTNAWNQKSVSVPGPLPIVGAGIAFGFSRKLRQRISLKKSA